MENTFNKYTFVVADDHKMITKSLAFVIKELYNDAVVHQINNISDVLKTLHTINANLLILDISFPDGNSLSIISTLKKIQPNLKILIFSGHEEDIYAVRYVNAGANGFVSKLSSEDEIKHAILSVMNTGKYLSVKVQDKITNSYILRKPFNPLEQLSNRELEIAQLMVDGYGNVEICSFLALQKSTVSTYKNRIFEKLQIDNMPDLIQLFNLNK